MRWTRVILLGVLLGLVAVLISGCSEEVARERAQLLGVRSGTGHTFYSHGQTWHNITNEMSNRGPDGSIWISFETIEGTRVTCNQGGCYESQQ